MRARRHFTAEFKARVALEAIRGDRTLAELAADHLLHPNLIMTWRRQAIAKMARVFDRKAGAVVPNLHVRAEIDRLHATIGKLVVDILAKANEGRNRSPEQTDL